MEVIVPADPTKSAVACVPPCNTVFPSSNPSSLIVLLKPTLICLEVKFKESGINLAICPFETFKCGL